MAYLKWSDEFAVNVGAIDNQHKRLFEMINSLHDAMINNKGPAAHIPIINDMVAYAKNHFDTEERYMRQYGYPALAGHKREHDLFTEKALELKARVDRAGFVLTLEVLNFLKMWLQDHILGTDQKYSGFFNEHGLH